MREIRLSGSEGGARASHLVPTSIRADALGAFRMRVALVLMSKRIGATP